jgi:RNA polymerase sigma-70 factor (ECF subfamily)
MLSETFIEAMRPAERARWIAAGHLEERLRGALNAFAQRWPDLHTDEEDLTRHLAGRVGKGVNPATWLSGEHVAELVLTSACALGDSAAIATVEREHFAAVRRAMAHAAGAVDDGLQRLRERLYIPTAAGGPKIEEYSGRGSLESWLCAVALRTGANVAREERRAGRRTADDESLLELCDGGPDPELALLKERYQDDVKDALREALREVAPQDQVLLRQFHIDGVGLSTLAKLHRRHVSNVSRRIAHIRQSVLEQTRRLLMSRLQLTPSELDSVVRLVRSQLSLGSSTLGNAQGVE